MVPATTRRPRAAFSEASELSMAADRHGRAAYAPRWQGEGCGAHAERVHIASRERRVGGPKNLAAGGSRLSVARSPALVDLRVYSTGYGNEACRVSGAGVAPESNGDPSIDINTASIEVNTSPRSRERIIRSKIK